MAWKLDERTAAEAGEPEGSRSRAQDDDRGAFGRMLRRLRMRASLSQAELADRAGLSVEAISALERGFRRHPRRATLALLADALRLPAVVDQPELPQRVYRGGGHSEDQGSRKLGNSVNPPSTKIV